ncbi:MAG: lipoate--protein ligase family protein [Verrucomicrobia bacterium]|nr:lipoate--protein ligase family protein [Verrucomicrobiota bacterium]
MNGSDWQVWLDEVPRPAALNMALDEALLSVAADRGVPVLRVYRWAEPAVSFGYFDRWPTVQAQFPDRIGVRRWTGGGAVDHAADVTFALVVPRTHVLGQATPLESYRCIHETLRAALGRIGIEATLAGACGAGGRPADGPAPCFVAPVCSDLMVGDGKVGGGAQRRTRMGLLHQGSLQGPPLTPELREALRGELARGAAPFTGDPAEIERRAGVLAAERYATVAWRDRW